MTGWRTLAAAFAATTLGVVETTDMANLLPNDPATAGWVSLGLGVLFGTLRTMTSTPVGTKRGRR